jgi:autotransporter adhesin
VAYDDASHGQLTLDGANGTRVSNVADGIAPTDAVNLGQMQAGDASTLASANTHADAGDVATLQSAHTYTDQKVATLNLDFTNFTAGVDDRFKQQDSRINKVGAMGTAMANMTASAAGVRTTNRLAIGVGNYRGENALAFGYQRALSDRAVITLGGAFNGDDSSVGAGAAIGW